MQIELGSAVLPGSWSGLHTGYVDTACIGIGSQEYGGGFATGDMVWSAPFKITRFVRKCYCTVICNIKERKLCAGYE